ncbi:hypothetical protein R5S71_003630 [Salmonella enterica]|nr:hypothetical protein [Salmonella enterica]HBJ6961524.1 hypothetical protein [Salmonella enterica subsp. enterica serovar Duisburg]EEM8545463.1 hypothetical protein [Salmonella enterica]EHD2121298.1 hypothetical protein [Salmonella enterica]EJB2592695.1 hypothetical protein [Salmonella enterica]
MHKDDLKQFRKGIREAGRKSNLMGKQLNEGNYEGLKDSMRICATKLNAMIDELNIIIEQQDSNV